MIEVSRDEFWRVLVPLNFKDNPVKNGETIFTDKQTGEVHGKSVNVDAPSMKYFLNPSKSKPKYLYYNENTDETRIIDTREALIGILDKQFEENPLVPKNDPDFVYKYAVDMGIVETPLDNTGNPYAILQTSAFEEDGYFDELSFAINPSGYYGIFTDAGNVAIFSIKEEPGLFGRVKELIEEFDSIIEIYEVIH